MTFHPGQLLVFDKGGAYLGVLTGWSVSVPRSYGINDIEDFAIILPLLNQNGTPLVTTALATSLLNEDNLVYVEDEMYGLPGWGGVIDRVIWANDTVELKFLGGLSLVTALSTGTRIAQVGGTAATVAQRLISAANAKKAPHGDLQIGLVVDASTPLYGNYNYDGDIYSGLLTLASDTISEFWADWVLGPGAATLAMNIHWDKRVIKDHSAIVLTDGGALPNLKTGSTFMSSGLEVLNRVRLKGAPTHLADFLDYDCIKSVVKDVSPELDYEVPGLPNMRLREDLSLSVHFGLSDAMQKQIATTGYDDPVTGIHTPGIQESYLAYYKTFLYAYHNWQGKPFLNGFDWSGPDGTNDKQLTLRYMRTWNKLGKAHGTSIVTSGTDGALPNVVIDQWSLDVAINPLSGACVGVALDWATQGGHWLANGVTGNLILLAADNTTMTTWGNVTGGGGTLLSIATDPGSINQVWVLVVAGGVYTVKSYDIQSNALLLSYVIPSTGTPNDIAVDVVAGRLYVAGSTGTLIHVYDLASGSAISPDPSFAAGGTGNTVGISVTGGIAYVLLDTGEVRMLFVNGTFAGTFSTGLSGAKGLYADFTNRRVWIVRSDGSIAIYHAYVAVGTITGGGSVAGAPGFSELVAGQFVHIVMSSAGTLTPASASAGTSGSYTVVSGDTLWGIAIRFYGNGSLWRTIYNANLAVIGANPNLIFPGQHYVIPGVYTTPPAGPTSTKYFITYAAGRWQQTTVPGPLGQPDQLQRTWLSDPAVTGFNHQYDGSTGIEVADPHVVIVGEEGRVCDWNPTLDGYGLLKTDQRWTTPQGHAISTGPGWYPQQWDVPDRVFEPPSSPVWPEGVLYAQDFLAHRNRKVTAQQIRVVNANGLWGQIERGGTYTLNCTTQGPRPGGMSLVIRVIKFSPNDVTGELEIVAEAL